MLPETVIDPIYDLSHFCHKESEQRGEFCPVGSFGVGWTTLAVPHSNYDLENCPVVIHVGCRSVTNHRKDFCAIFNFSGMRDLFPYPPVLGMVSCETYAALVDSPIRESKKFVFVRIAELAQDGQQGREICVRSVVWLHGLNDCPHALAHVSQFSPTNGIIERLPTIGYGEGELAFIAGRVRGRLLRGNGENQVVKCSPEIANTVCDHERPSQQWRRLIDSQDNAVACVIGVYTVDDTIWASAHIGLDFVLDKLSVFLTAS